MRIEQNSGNLFSFCSWISIRDTSIIGLSMIELSHRNLSLIWKQSTLTTIHSPVHILIQTITTTKQETVWRWVGPVDWTKTINAYKCYYWWTTLTKSLEFDRHIFHLIGFSHFYLYIYIYMKGVYNLTARAQWTRKLWWIWLLQLLLPNARMVPLDPTGAPRWWMARYC